MKAGFSFDDGLTARLASLPDAISRRVQANALTAGAEPMRAMAATLAPRDVNSSGPHLADHIIAKVLTDNQEIDLVGHDIDAIVAIGPAKGFFYGRFQELAAEYGGVQHAAQPFMRPAFDANRHRSLEIVRQHLWAAIRRIDKTAFNKQSTSAGTSRGRSSGTGL